MHLLFTSEQAVIQYKMQILNIKKSNKEEKIKNNAENINSNVKPSLFGNYKISEAKAGFGDVNVSMSSSQGSNKMNYMMNIEQLPQDI